MENDYRQPLNNPITRSNAQHLTRTASIQPLPLDQLGVNSFTPELQAQSEHSMSQMNPASTSQNNHYTDICPQNRHLQTSVDQHAA